MYDNNLQIYCKLKDCPCDTCGMQDDNNEGTIFPFKCPSAVIVTEDEESDE